MGQVMTIDEIRDQFRSEWVLVEDPVTNEHMEVLSGKVLYHSSDRDEFDRRSLEFHPQNFAVLYTGTIPADMAVVL